MGKTKVISGKNLHLLKHSCGVCCNGVVRYSVFCTGCQLWIHKKCSGNKGKLTADPLYKYTDELVFAVQLVGDLKNK